jgi:hypothetical protein
MAKGRNREKSKKGDRDAAPAEQLDRQAVAIPGVKRHLRRLERLLADAAKKEGKRIRKLERARWRRQRLEAEIMVIRGATAATGPAKAVAVRTAPAKARPVKAAPAAKPVTGGAAARRTAPRGAPAKPASPRRAPSSRSTSAGTSPGKASPGDGTTPKT